MNQPDSELHAMAGPVPASAPRLSVVPPAFGSAEHEVGSRASRDRAPVSPRAYELVRRADAELLAAQYSSEPWEQFSHAHLAALRVGAAVVALRGAPGGRRPPRTVWAMLRQSAPELDGWSDYFEAGASVRAAIDAGRFDAVTADRAEQTLCTAEDFVDAARAIVLAGADAARSARAS